MRARWLTLLCAACAGIAAAAPASRVPTADRRGEEQTYLTFPEWFLVFSPDEFADSLEAGGTPSRFPWFSHVGQFWSAYAQVWHATKPYPFNGEYHTMIAVIGSSTTVEYGIRGAYETLVGRLSELASSPGATPEDQLAAREARDYVEFIRVRPWYEFDFATPLKRLWTETPAFGPDMLRKWERRYLLTSDWLVKATYAAVLEKATHSAFEIPKTTTVCVVREGDHARTVALPRYQAFTDAAVDVARRGGAFEEIAGNRGPILVSVVVPDSRPTTEGTSVLIRQPILTRPGFERRVLRLPVPRLADVLRTHVAAGDAIEHVFDY